MSKESREFEKWHMAYYAAWPDEEIKDIVDVVRAAWDAAEAQSIAKGRQQACEIIQACKYTLDLGDFATDMLCAEIEPSGNSGQLATVTCTLGLDPHEDCRDTPCQSCTAHDEVAQGGVCEWKPMGNQDWHQTCTPFGDIILREKFKFCPYCGKTIRVSGGGIAL